MVEEEQKPRLAVASGFGDIAGLEGYFNNNYYMPNGVDTLGRASGILPEKLIIPREYHAVIQMCYDFYQRGGIVGTVVNRLTEMSMTAIVNGQRKTTDEANEYYNAVLHRAPSRLNRFIHTAALEYFLSGMVLPRVEWKEVTGADLSPKLKAGKKYMVPVADLYPANLVRVDWAGWGTKKFFLKIPEKDLRLIRGARQIKNQQLKKRYRMWEQDYPAVFQAVKNGEKEIEITTDAILRKEVSYSQYPTPFLFNVLESLVHKQQLRRMDYAVASRIITAILLVQEGSDEFPITEETRGNLDELKKQIAWYAQHPEMMQRLFPLFTNHTTKLSWIQPDVQALLDQEKFRQVNDEISEGLGFAKILVTGESRNAQASEVSTWAIQPMMEELREMMLEWLTPVYEEAQELNGFRQVPEPNFTPIRLQDFIKTAAVFAQAFKEGNVSRTTRAQMMGLNFETEVELIKDEGEKMKEINKESKGKFPSMPYDIQSKQVEQKSGGLGRPPAANVGGRPKGSQNVPVNNRNRGIKPPGQSPTSRVAAEIAPMTDEDFFETMDQVARDRGLTITMADVADIVEDFSDDDAQN